MANGHDTVTLQAEGARTNEVALRLCQAEVQAALEKYGMTLGIKRIETHVAGAVHIDYNLMFMPKPRGNGEKRPA